MPGDFESKLRAVLTAHEPERVVIEDAKDAAILIPIVAEPEPTLLFTLRTDCLPSHKGQISFPGGSVDPSDGCAQEAALREASEEIGLAPSEVRILGEMDSMPTYVSGYVVSPFVGWLERRPALAPNEAEVAAVLDVPISSLTEDIHVDPGFSLEGRTFPTEAWIHDGRVIWGFTARVVRVLLERLAEAGLAAHPGKDPWPDMPIPPRASTP